jgi:hydrogenase maturation protease
MREVVAVRTPVLVLGIGNPLRGDDGIGPRLVEELVRIGLPQEVTALDVGPGGLDLFRVLEGWERAVIVDTADVGQEPGQIVRFTPDQVRLALATDGVSLHHAGLGEVIALADALGQTLPKMAIFGVQPAGFDWWEGLSPAVEAALPALVDAVIGAIEE